MEINNQISETDYMDRLIEDGIIELINLFRNDPAQFEYENELCYSFHDILVNKLCNNDEFKIRWEQKSMMSYEGKKPSTESKFYAKYDLSLIKENLEAVPYAFEFKLFKDLQYDNIDINYFTPTRIKELIDDLEKLTNPNNKVEHGYILTFIYGNISANYKGRINRHKEKIVDVQNLINTASVKNNINMACIHSSEIGSGSSIIGIHRYPESYCHSVNLKEGFFHK